MLGKKPAEAEGKLSSTSGDILLGLSFNAEDESDIFLGNIGLYVLKLM
jgi:hypothetical protein